MLISCRRLHRGNAAEAAKRAGRPSKLRTVYEKRKAQKLMAAPSSPGCCCYLSRLSRKPAGKRLPVATHPQFYGDATACLLYICVRFVSLPLTSRLLRSRGVLLCSNQRAADQPTVMTPVPRAVENTRYSSITIISHIRDYRHLFYPQICIK